jgi:hypothetical protein
MPARRGSLKNESYFKVDFNSNDSAQGVFGKLKISKMVIKNCEHPDKYICFWPVHSLSSFFVSDIA